jgi:hypothetical protein
MQSPKGQILFIAMVLSVKSFLRLAADALDGLVSRVLRSLRFLRHLNLVIDKMNQKSSFMPHVG